MQLHLRRSGRDDGHMSIHDSARHAASLPADLVVDALTTEDAPALNALVNALAATDGTGETEPLESTREFLSTPGTDLALDTVAVRRGDELIAYGGVNLPEELTHDGRVRARLQGGVRAADRRAGIGTLIFGLLERRAVQLAATQHPGAPGYLESSGGLAGDPVRHLLEARGYTAVRDFHEMTRALDTQIDERALPAAYTAVSPDEGHKATVRTAHHAAFADHWGSAPISEGRWEQFWHSHAARPALSSIALDDDGTAIAYVIAQEWEPRELYIALVGTTAAARGRGVARALITRTLQLAKASGNYDTVDLGVDAESLTGATRLYTDLGFRTDKVFTSYQRDLPTA